MSFGAQFYNADGTPVLQDDETFSRVVYKSPRITGQTSGTLSVPEFDSSRGMAYMVFYTPQPNYHMVTPPAFMPMVSWDNTAKEFTYTPGATWGITSLVIDFNITCLHFL